MKSNNYRAARALGVLRLRQLLNSGDLKTLKTELGMRKATDADIEALAREALKNVAGWSPRKEKVEN